MELRHLRSFVSVAEELHFGRAAAQLHIVQSAVSQQIRLLEDELGVRLFERTRHHVVLTEAGRVFLPEARRTLLQAEAAMRVARAASAGTIGHLEFGFVDNAIWSALPAVLRQFRESYPGIELRLQQNDRVVLLDGIAEGRLDIALVPAPLPAPGPEGPVFGHETLLEAAFLVALPQDHPLAARPALGLDELADEAFVLFPPSMQTRLAEMVLAACTQAGFIPRVTQEARQMHTLLALVGAGFGITLVPEWAAATHTAGLVYRPVKTPMPSYKLLMVFRAARTTPIVEAFRQLAMRVVRKLEQPE